MEDILSNTFQICLFFIFVQCISFFFLLDAWLFQDWLRIFKVLFIATGLVYSTLLNIKKYPSFM